MKTKLMAMLLAAGAMLGAWADTEAVDGKSCALSVKVTPNGKAVATLTYDTGKKSKGKAVYYKPSCSTVVLPDEAPDPKAFTGSVYMYFAPSADNNFPGGGDCVYVSVGH